MYNTILFDLDGTLTNPMKSFSRCLNYVVTSMDAKMPKGDELLKWVGPPIGESFKNFLGFDDIQAEKALTLYRNYYASEGGLNGNEMYDGIEDMLKALKARGKTLAVATCKLEDFALQILKENGIIKYFDVVCGASRDNSRTQKFQIINKALEMLGVEDKSSVIMVGDRFHDIEGARKSRLKAIGVLWGYGSRDELLAYGAVDIAEKPTELLEKL